ncbi:MAG TPA: TCP-1/cpn60 chaperonin family protein [Candidatus Bathyarchaeia archaeon]|jgi:chaperonin GroEL (HSP60 family)|nr:TCP-1/cpn60 chaperonin family protein [Candidatus Bathyarchaeia archaeon]
MAVAQQVLPATPQILLKHKGRLSGKDLWRQNLSLASLAAYKIGSSLGPKGAYKLVTYHRGPELVMKVTKDPIDIVDELGIEYPAKLTLAEAAKIQRQHTGDGISSLLVLVSSLLTQADKLMGMGFHQNTILDGFLKATEKSAEIINEVGRIYSENLDEHLLEVVDCGRELLSKRLRNELSEAVTRATENGSVDITRIRIVKKPGGQVDDTKLVRGVIIKQGKAHFNMPDLLNEPKVAFLNKLEIKRRELISKDEGPFVAKLNITDQGQIQSFKLEENRLRNLMVETIKASGANILFCRTKIDDRTVDLLGRQGIFTAHFVGADDFEAAARATRATIAATPDQLGKEDLGIARKLEVDKIKPDQIIVLHCDEGATVLLRSSSPELLEELEKTVKKALLILKHSRSNSKVVPGGGAILAELAKELRKYALTFEGRGQFVISSYADALEKITECLSINYGLDPIDTMIQLRNAHAKGERGTGIGAQGCEDMYDANIIELSSVNKANVNRAFELVSLLLRIDDCFYVKDIPKFHK